MELFHLIACVHNATQYIHPLSVLEGLPKKVSEGNWDLISELVDSLAGSSMVTGMATPLQKEKDVERRQQAELEAGLGVGSDSMTGNHGN